MPLISHHAKLVTALMLLFLFAFGSLSTVAHASTSRSKFEAAVRLIVSADGPLKGIVSSYVSQRLRLLDGVVVTDVDPDYALSVIVIETMSRAGIHRGYAISSVGSMLWKRSDIEEMLMDAYGSYQELSLFIPAWANSGNIKHHILQTGTDLEEMCRELVASFDTDVLEHLRKLYTQQLRDKSK